ncbi:hypothetical protein DFP72DRAFT_625442 [Ephemerocybe angulata]|uniref:Uncharacterized protein n=1 Tax=Ephemerocybe angulata TaxID=980116 RepID=A0A8H6IC95_9AGAR|nr:hypothetical protein DFP72DRAFT_625442 [Tulosesus angulatus]
MTASQIYLLEPLPQDYHLANPFSPAPFNCGSTPSSCHPLPSLPCAMNTTYIEHDWRFQEEQRSVPRAIQGHISAYNQTHVPQNYYTTPAQQLWQPTTRYSSGGSVEDSPPSLADAGFGFHSNSLWQTSASYNAVQDESHLIHGSPSYSTYPISSPASVPSDLSGYSLGSSSYQTHCSPQGSPHTLSLSASPPQVATLALTPPLQSTAIPSQPSSSSSTKKYTYRQEYELFVSATNLPAVNAGPFVPQTIYKPHTNSDRKRYVEEVALEGPLYFAMQGPSEYGIPLSDALHSRVKRLVDREKPVFEGRGPSVSIRLEWPGYRQWTRQIPTKDFRSPPGPITMAKLAKNIAKCVQRFIDENKDRNLEEHAQRRWKVGNRPHELKLDDLVLVSLHHVSLGSWQPHIRLRRSLNMT